jgi:hypothetical protein
MEIAIHVNAAKCPFHGINFAVLIAIQLLEMFMRHIVSLRTRDAGRYGAGAGIVALRILEHPVRDQIFSRLYDRLGSGLL